MKPEPIDSIAIVGIGCRFPGGADNPDIFWENLCAGLDARVEVPKTRWDVRRFYDPNPDKPGKSYVRHGAFLHQDPYAFDAEFFGISPREAANLDPQQQLLLEVTWEAFEDAGITLEQLQGSRTGVYVGCFNLDNKVIHLSPHNRHLINSHTPTSSTMAILSNRIAYVFDLHGPAITLDTACSSSLVAFHYACRDLRNGDCSMALVGGVNVMLIPGYSIIMSKGKFLASDGRSKAFDQSADGYGRGEGAGVVILKPLSDALAAGDAIYAIVRGSGVNQDGRTDGIALPNQAAQEALIQQVQAESRVSPEQIQYVEAHGTGTQAGDHVETAALGRAIGTTREAEQPLLIGSVKTNIGHLEAAAGVAGIIKTSLSLQHLQIPPSLHFERPNPNIDFNGLNLRVVTQLQDWPRHSGPAVACINSFGYGGTNAHALLAQAPGVTHSASPQGEPSARLLPLSAKSAAALKALARRYAEFLTPSDSSREPDLNDLCHSAAIRRSHHPHRAAIAFDSRQELAFALASLANGEAAPGLSVDRAGEPLRLVFVYTGMGTQWWAMGRELWHSEPVFKTTLETCDAIYQRLSGESLLAELLADEDASRMDRPDVAQPGNFFVQAGLTALWRSWGVRPDAIVGHSVGEIAAAHAAGCLTLEDGLQITFHRCRLQQSLAGQGRMLAVGISEARARDLLEGLEDLISLASINSANSVTLAGDPDALEEVAALLTEQDIFNRFLFVNVAYHSDQMTPLRDEFIAAIHSIRPQPANLPLYSTVHGGLVDSQQQDAHYWWRNLRDCVHFKDAMSQLIEDGHNAFLEVGPHPALGNAMRECLAEHSSKGRCLFSLHRKQPERQSLLNTLAGLYTAGYPMDWRAIAPQGSFIRLPLYPFQREHHRIESVLSLNHRLGPDQHPLLGQPVPGPGLAREIELNAQYFPYLPDHRVQDAIVFPGSGYVEAALLLDQYLAGQARCSVLEAIEFSKPLVLTDLQEPLLRIQYEPQESRIDFFSCADPDQAEWNRHARIRLIKNVSGEQSSSIDLNELRRRCTQQTEKGDLYQGLARRGLHYGRYFQAIERLWSNQTEVVAELLLHPDLRGDEYCLHPCILDAAFQSLLAVLGDDGADRVFVPVGIDQLRFYHRPTERLFSHGRIIDRQETTLTGDIQLLDAHGRVIADIRGFCCRALPRQSETNSQDWLYQTRWEAHTTAAEDWTDLSGCWLLFCDRPGVASAEYLRAIGSRCIEVLPGHDGDTDEAADRIPLQPGDRDAMTRLIANASPLRGIVYRWTLSPGEQPGLDDCLTLLHIVKALGNAHTEERFSFIVATEQAQSTDTHEAIDNLSGASIWGLVRVIANEYPAWVCNLIDLDRDGHLPLAVFTAQKNHEFAVRGDRLLVRRLVSMQRSEEFPTRITSAEAGSGYELALRQPGNMDSLYYREELRRRPNAREIEARVHAVPLNFKDIMKTMGMLSERVLKDTFLKDNFGMECAAVVIAVGDEISEVKIGDRVIINAGNGCFHSYMTVNVDDTYVIPMPNNLRMDQAPLVPYMAVYHGLHDLAQLKPEETILIHSGAGGVGLAAIYYAQSVGATILATAGSPEKRTYLEELGVDLVMDSRSLLFADQVLERTQGRGVDVVINSLSGEALMKTLSIVRHHGRFIEIGKRDIDENTPLRMEVFNRGLLFAAIDMDRYLAADRAESLRILGDICREIESGKLKPIPSKIFPAAEVVGAFRYMAQARHIGKVVVSLDDCEVEVEIPSRLSIQPDATYLITGGLGGFGFESAKWLLDKGATALALVSRSGKASTRDQTLIEQWRAKGVSLRIIAADLGKQQDVARVFETLRAEMPPLKGIIHAAGVLDDALLGQMTDQQFARVMHSKAEAAWNLHHQSQGLELDLFLLYSSVSALVGNAGQGNYAAANAYLDALAEHRHAQGQPAVSINWGAISETGMVARNPGIAEHLENLGIRGSRPSHALAALDSALSDPPPHLGIMDIEWGRWSEANPVAHRCELFAPLLSRAKTSSRSGLVDLLSLLDTETRTQVLRDSIQKQVARILKLPASRLDPDATLENLGVDSLMSVEIQTSIHGMFGVELTTMTLMKGVSVHRLVEKVQAGLKLADAEPQQKLDADELQQVLQQLAEMN